jgi:peptidoglycan/xylan/chitin deacetylase (PgdA/CDA1 family)
MYHALGYPGEPASRYVLPVRRFAQHMSWLRARRYNVLPAQEVLTALRANRLPPPRSVVVTLDDGYRDNLELGLPILQQMRLPATIFAVSGRLGQSNDWEAAGPLAGRPLLTRGQMRTMLSDDLDFGAHSRTHSSLPTLPLEAAADEITGSRLDLERAALSNQLVSRAPAASNRVSRTRAFRPGKCRVSRSRAPGAWPGSRWHCSSDTSRASSYKHH